MTTDTTTSNNLSNALEDYLETIFELVRDNRMARIKDIAKARNVKSASVIPAMRRLADMGLITYVKREYIDLTDEGERAARRVYARHKLLTKFLKEILGMPDQLATEDACAMEHNLSDEGMDHLVRFFEFLESCPSGHEFLDRFKGCSVVNANISTCKTPCSTIEGRRVNKAQNLKHLMNLKTGETGKVVRILGSGPVRQRILDMGILPDVEIVLERRSPAGAPIWIKFQGSHLSLRKKEAESIIVLIP